MGLAADANVHVFVDANNDSSTSYFSVEKNAETTATSTTVFRVSEAPFVGVNESSNLTMTIGLAINQGANDNDALACMSSDVTHGCTTLADTASYFTVSKVVAGGGGALVRGLIDGGGDGYGAILLDGLQVDNADTTQSTAGRAIVEVWGRQISGTGVANVVDHGNVFAVRCRSGGSNVTLFLVDEDGDLLSIGGAATAFDEYQDAEMARALDLARAPERAIRSRWDEYVRYNEDTLVQAGVLGAPLAEGGLINVTRLQQLHNGAIWQNYTEIRELRETVARYERALLALGADPALLEG